MPRTRISPAAGEDLRDIRVYSKAAFGAQAAAKYMEGFRAIFRMLRERPYAGIAHPRLGEDVRSFSYRAHRIYYRPETEGVLIVRILHHAQDFSAAFGDLQ